MTAPAGRLLALILTLVLSCDDVNEFRGRRNAPANNPKVPLLTVEGSIDLENTAVTEAMGPRPVVPDSGVIDITTGGVISCARETVKLKKYAGEALPAKSRTPATATFTTALAGSGEFGVNVATGPLTA
jgi:hypothetical protein